MGDDGGVLVVGVTGGIGAGKSAVAGRLVRRGAVLIDADRLAREVVGAGTEGLAEVVAAFGAEVVGPDGELDRPALGVRVFGDEQARRQLEGIIHPRVRARSVALAAAAPPGAIVINDIPLLVETGLGPTFPLVVVVEASSETRLRRLTEVRGMGHDEARARIAAQASDAERRAAADVLLRNDSGLAELDEAVDRLWVERLVPFEANLRRGRCADQDASIGAPDPTWPAQAARIAARIRHALRSVPVADTVVTHVGPTAVAGLRAADIIDLLVTVPAADQAEAVSPALIRAGLPRRAAGSLAGWAADALPGTDDAARRPDLWHGSADPGRAVSVRVAVAGSPGWRSELLLRDYLRAVPDAREPFLAAQREAVDGDADGLGRQLGPCEAWQLWHEGAERWATRTGWTPTSD